MGAASPGPRALERRRRCLALHLQSFLRRHHFETSERPCSRSSEVYEEAHEWSTG